MTFKKKTKQAGPESAIGVDLGGSQVKAAMVTRYGAGFRLAKYSVQPVAKGATVEQYTAYLLEALKDFGDEAKQVRVTISCPSAMVCQAELPRVPLEEIKGALRTYSSHYLRRDFSNYYLDACELLDGEVKETEPASPKIKLLIGGATKDEVNWYRGALTAAKLTPVVIELSAVSVVNALQVGQTELCQKDVVLLVDIGARATSINFLRNGQPVITRITAFGGDTINDLIVQMLSVDLKAAEEEKRKMSDAVQPIVSQAVQPLVREIRSSIDFFERQYDCHVARGFACGGSACSMGLLQMMSEEIGYRLESWNPVSTFDTSHFNGEGPKLEALAPSLAAAVGVAVGPFRTGVATI